MRLRKERRRSDGVTVPSKLDIKKNAGRVPTAHGPKHQSDEEKGNARPVPLSVRRHPFADRALGSLSGGELQRAVLARALAEHHPGAPLTVLVLPLKGGREEPFEEIELDDLEPPAAAELLRRERRWRELAEFIKPRLLRHLLAADGATAVFLDAEVDVYAPLETVTPPAVVPVAAAFWILSIPELTVVAPV